MAAALRYLGDADALYVYLSPATAFAAPALLRSLYRVPSVVHVQDLWPDAVTSSPMAPKGLTGRFMNHVLAAAMRRIYRASASVAVTAPSMRDMIIERGADPGKVRVVLNWTDEKLFRPVEVTEAARQAIGHRGRCTVMHAGNIGPFQDITGAIRAAAALADTGQLDLVLVGTGLEEEAARRLTAELGADNIRFLGRRDPATMADLIGAADYQLISLRDAPSMYGAIPSKLQAALSCGSPVIAAAPGDAARFVADHRAGLTCPPGDWAALAGCFRQAALVPVHERAAMGRRAHECYERLMSMRSAVDQLEDLLRAAAGRRTLR
jgi:glycosyltransferase involved in cell wall biosynthesis